jgi:hypothetical protein
LAFKAFFEHPKASKAKDLKLSMTSVRNRLLAPIPVPEFDDEAIGAKYKAVKHETITAAESKVWERIQLLNDFRRERPDLR